MSSKRIKIPGILWLLFMVLVVAPAFMVASSLEMATTYQKAVGLSHWLMTKNMYYPQFMAGFFAYPVAAIGLILPSSASLIAFPFEMFLEGSGPILTYCFFAGVSRPLFLKERSGQDEVRLAGAGNPFSAKRFLQTAVGLAILIVICEVWTALYRDPVPDNYKGEVYIGEKHRKNALIKDVEMTIKIASNRSFFNPSTWADREDINITFSGKGNEAMRNLGFSVKQDEGEHYVNMSCNIRSSSASRNEIWGFFAIHFDLSFTSDSPCKPIKMGAENFDKLELVTTSPSGIPLYAILERDSRIGIIQNLVMRLNYKKSNYGHIRTFQNK